MSGFQFKPLMILMVLSLLISTGSALTIFNIEIGIPGTDNVYFFSDVPTNVRVISNSNPESIFDKIFVNNVMKSEYDGSGVILPNGVEVRESDSRFPGDGSPITFDDDEDECENDDEEECEPRPPIKIDPIKIQPIANSTILPIQLQLSMGSDKSIYQCDFASCEQISVIVNNPNSNFNEPVYLIIRDNSDDTGSISNVNNYQKIGNNSFALNSPFILPIGSSVYTINFNAFGNGKFDIMIVGANTGEVYALLDPWWNSAWGKRKAFNVSGESAINDYVIMQTINTANLIIAGDLQSDCSDLRFTLGEDKPLTHWIRDRTGVNCNQAGTQVFIQTNLTGGGVNDTHYMYYDNPTAGNISDINSITTSSTNLAHDYENNELTDTAFWSENFQKPQIGASLALTQTEMTGGALKSGVDPITIFGASRATTMGNTTNLSMPPLYTMVNAYKCDMSVAMIATACIRPLVTNANTSGGIGLWQDFATQTEIFYVTDYNETNYVQRESTDFQTWTTKVTGTIGNYTEVYGAVNRVAHSSSDAGKTATATTEFVFARPTMPGQSDFGSNDVNVSGFGIEENLIGGLFVVNPIDGTTFQGNILNLNFSLNNSAFATQNVNLTFNDVFNKTFTGVVNDSFENETFTMADGTYKIVINSNESFSDPLTVTFNIANATTTSVLTTNETQENAFDLSVDVITGSSVTATLMYNGTPYIGVVESSTTTQFNLTTNVTAPLIPVNDTNISFTWVYTITGASSGIKQTPLEQQQILHAFYIESVDTPTSVQEGAEIIQNITARNLLGTGTIQIFANTTDGTTAGVFQSGTDPQNWTTTFNVPAVSGTITYPVDNSLRITIGNQTNDRFFIPTTNITVNDLGVGVCGTGNFTVPILNYTTYNEESPHAQFTTGLVWETEVVATSGTVESLFGFNSTGSSHPICIEPGTEFTADVFTTIEKDGGADYFKRSHFLRNYIIDAAPVVNNISIYLLNASKSAEFEIFVKDAFEKFQPDRNIHVYKFFPVNNSYIEMFSLLTDENGGATGYFEPVITWYKIIVTNDAGGITKTLNKTQMTTSPLIIIEDETEGLFDYGEFSVNFIFDNITAQAIVSHTNPHDYRLVVTDLDVLNPTVICTYEDSGTSAVILFCTPGATEFTWQVQILQDNLGTSFYRTIASGTEFDILSTPFSVGGLIFGGIFIIFAGLLFVYDAKVSIIISSIGLSIMVLTGVIVLHWSSVVFIWFIAAVLLYTLRGDN